jgi:hypothetical protein
LLTGVLTNLWRRVECLIGISVLGCGYFLGFSARLPLGLAAPSP